MDLGSALAATVDRDSRRIDTCLQGGVHLPGGEVRGLIGQAVTWRAVVGDSLCQRRHRNGHRHLNGTIALVERDIDRLRRMPSYDLLSLGRMQ